MAKRPIPTPPVHYDAMSDEDLALRAQAGDRAAFGALALRYEPRLFNFLLRRTKSRTDAEELAQEAVVRAWERVKSYDPRWRFSTWVFTIATRLAVSEHRKHRPTTGLDASQRTGFAPEPVEEREHRAIEGSRLWALAAELTEDQHTALWLRYVEDLAIPEIAAVLGKSQVGVRVCLFRARQALIAKVESEKASDGNALEGGNPPHRNSASAPSERGGKSTDGAAKPARVKQVAGVQPESNPGARYRIAASAAGGIA